MSEERRGKGDLPPTYGEVSRLSEIPRISVIVPAYNSGKTIGQCLDGLVTQDYPKDRFEIIVVDSGSDNTREVCLSYGIRYYHMPSQTYAGAARNIGISHSKGDILAFIDSDCIAPRDWLSKIVDDLAEYPGVCGVGGIPSSFLNFHKKRKEVCVFYFMEGNCALKREIFDQGCRFGEGYLKDHESVVAFLKENGLSLLLDPWLVVDHPEDSGDMALNWKSRLRKKYLWGVGYGKSLVAPRGERRSRSEIVKAFFVLLSIPFMLFIILYPINFIPFIYVNLVFLYNILRMHKRYLLSAILRDLHVSLAIRWAYWAGIVIGLLGDMHLFKSKR